MSVQVQFFDRVQETIDLVCVHAENGKSNLYLRQLILQQSRLIANEFSLRESDEANIENSIVTLLNISKVKDCTP